MSFLFCPLRHSLYVSFLRTCFQAVLNPNMCSGKDAITNRRCLMPDRGEGISRAKRRGAAHISSLLSSSLQTLIKVSTCEEMRVWKPSLRLSSYGCSPFHLAASQTDTEPASFNHQYTSSEWHIYQIKCWVIFFHINLGWLLVHKHPAWSR